MSMPRPHEMNGVFGTHRLNPAAGHLRAELPRAGVAECRQDAEEAWPQAGVHDQGGGRPAPAPQPQAARHRLSREAARRSPRSPHHWATATVSAWSRWSTSRAEDLESAATAGRALFVRTRPWQAERASAEANAGWNTMRRMGRSVLPWSSTIPSGFHQPSSSFPTTARWELDPSTEFRP